MQIAVVGTGYVGLVSGTCFAEFGIHVTCVDKDQKKIESLLQGKSPIYEPGLETLMEKGVKANRLKFTTDLPNAVKNADVVFIAVGTPMQEGDGHADLSYVFAAAREIILAADGYTVIVTKSTVPVDTAKKLESLIKELRPDADIDVVSNPEFLREGSAIEDFMRPDRIVVGTRSQRAAEVMQQLYRPLYLLETPIVVTTPESSELIKYASNSFLAAKIAFINEVSDLCEKCGADVSDVAKGIGLDGRIGRKFLHVGPGYGGSCFPKDTLAMAKTAQDYGTPLSIIETVIASNDRRKRAMADRIIQICGGNVSGKKIAILGVTFKPNTDDMRDSPSLTIIPLLQAQGAKIFAYDPAGMSVAASFLPGVTWGKDAYDIMSEADAVVIITEWNEFRSLNLNQIKSLVKTPVIIDLRNIYPIVEMEKSGFSYHSLGRSSLGA